MQDNASTLEYIRTGLDKGQQVFRAVVLKKLLKELDTQPAASQSVLNENIRLKQELALAKKQLVDCQRLGREARAKLEAMEK